MPYDSPLPRGHTLGSDEGRMQQHELMDLVTKLSDRCEALETDLRQTKKVFGDAFTRLIKKVKKLEQIVETSHARRRSRVVISNDVEEDLEDSSKHGRMIEEKLDSRMKGLLCTGSGGVSTASRLVSTASASMPVSTASTVQEVNKDKGKGIMTESEPKQTKTRLQQRQERAGYEAAVRLQEQLDEEERQGIARVHEEASSFNIEEWEDIQATIEADEELAQRIQAEERENTLKLKKQYCLQNLSTRERDILPNKELKKGGTSHSHKLNRELICLTISRLVQEQPEEEETELSQEDLQQMMMVVPMEEVYVEALQVKYLKIDWEIYSEDTRRYWRIIRVGNHIEAYQTFNDMLNKFNRDDRDKLWSLVKERFSLTDPTDDKERTLWVELKRLFEPDTDDILWKLQRYMHDPLT
ncbi:hypothetical protein Tco_0790945 [Tanacetum coccineum]